MTDDIRILIREVLAEELKTHEAVTEQSADAPRQENVSVPRNGDLTTFVQRVVARAADPAFVSDVQAGRLRFKASDNHSSAQDSHEGIRAVVGPALATSTSPAVFDKGLVTEKQIAALPEGALIHASREVTFTPLALDELRRRRIRMKRKTS